MMEAGAIQLWALRASENQYPKMVHDVHVRRSRGVTSQSMLVLSIAYVSQHGNALTIGLGEEACTHQVPSTAKDEDCWGKTQPDGFVLARRSALTATSLSRIVMVTAVSGVASVVS